MFVNKEDVLIIAVLGIVQLGGFVGHIEKPIHCMCLELTGLHSKITD